MNHRHLCLAAFAAALAVQGCANQSLTGAQALDEQLDGQAKTCTASTPDAANKATIAMSNDGWCGVSIAENDRPFALGLIGERPTHGRVFVHAVNARTRVEYTPNPGYNGADAFSVMLRPRSGGAETTLQVAVTVTGGAAPAAAPPARTTTPRATTPRRTTPARRAPAR